MWESRRVYNGIRFHVDLLSRQDGERRLQREAIRHPGAVTIVPLIGDHQVCLIRNQRPTVNQTLIELPAGTLEPNEDPAATAARELSEETGYVAGRMEQVLEFYLSPGILDEKMRLYVATQLQPGPPHREAAEQIENLIVDIDEALAMIDDGRIRDAKSIIGLWWLARRPKTEGLMPNDE